MDMRSAPRVVEERIDGGLTWTPATDTIHLDANLARVLGLCDRGITIDGPTYGTFIHPADMPRLLELGRKGLASRKPLRTTYALRDRHGRFRDVRSEGFWIENEAGEVVATCQRIVERDHERDETADKVASLAIQIVRLMAGAEGQSAQAIAEQIQIHLLRQEAESIS